MSDVRGKSVAVVGYGIAGALIAGLLARAGHQVQRFERRSGAEHGGGLLLAPAAVRILCGLGLEEALNRHGVAIHRVRIGNEKKTLLDWHTEAGFGVGIRRAALCELLACIDPGVRETQTGLAVRSVDAAAGTLTGADGKGYGPFDLIVGADGANSAVRTALTKRHWVHGKPRWNALSVLATIPATCDTGRAPSCDQYFHGGSHVSLWPVAAQTVVIAANVPTEQLGQIHDAEQWKRLLIGLVPAAAARLAHAELIGSWYQWRGREVSLRGFAHRRVVLVGDAAHSLSPQLGQGVRLALQSALSLSERLCAEDDWSLAVRQYEVLQRRLAKPYQRFSRIATPLFQSQHPLLIWARDTCLKPLADWQWSRRRILRALQT